MPKVAQAETERPSRPRAVEGRRSLRALTDRLTRLKGDLGRAARHTAVNTQSYRVPLFQRKLSGKMGLKT